MNLEELSNELINAKKLEAEASAKRIEIENKIFELISINRADFHVVSSYSYQADPCDLMLATMSWPSDIQPAYLSPKLDEKRLKKIMFEMPKLWTEIAHLVEVKQKEINFSAAIA